MMTSPSFLVKNTFYDEEPSAEPTLKRSSSVPRNFSPAVFLTGLSMALPPQAVDEPIDDFDDFDDFEPGGALKWNTLPFKSLKLEPAEPWTDDDAETTDDELLRTSSDATKYSSESEMWSTCSDVPSPVPTCASIKGVQKTPLTSKAAPFTPLSSKAALFQPQTPFVPQAQHQTFVQQTFAPENAAYPVGPLPRRCLVPPPAPAAAAPRDSIFGQEASSIVRALKQVVESNNAGNVQILCQPTGWTLCVQVNREQFKMSDLQEARETVLELLKDSLFRSAEASSCAYVMGSHREPFVYEKNGWSVVLGAMVDETRACWDAYRNGFCRSRNVCKLDHPSVTVGIKVLVEAQERGW